MKTLFSISLAALALAACASDLKPKEARGAYSEGYTEHALSSNRYLISYRMDGSDYQRAYDLALWRAAQLSLAKGYPVFEVVSRDSDTDAGSRASSYISTDYGVAYQRSCGLLACTTRATPTTINRFETTGFDRPASRVVSLEVLLVSDTSTSSPQRYDAASIISNATRP